MRYTRKARRAARLATRTAAKRTAQSDAQSTQARPMARDTAEPLFRAMMPERTGQARAKASVPRSHVTVLQTITARGTGKYTRGKRTVRYTSVPDWQEHRIGVSDPAVKRMRILPPKRRKGE